MNTRYTTTNYTLPVLFTFCLGVPGLNLAVELEPGKWGITSSISSPMAPEPTTEYVEDCIEQSDFDPIAEMMEQGMSSMCEITVNEDSASRLDADLSCDMQGAGTMAGKIQFTANERSAQGDMQMSMSFNGQSINMANSWKAEYLGACD